MIKDTGLTGLRNHLKNLGPEKDGIFYILHNEKDIEKIAIAARNLAEDLASFLLMEHSQALCFQKDIRNIMDVRDVVIHVLQNE